MCNMYSFDILRHEIWTQQYPQNNVGTEVNGVGFFLGGGGG